MAVIMTLVSILFVSGVYCEPTEPEEFPSRYVLQSCTSNSVQLRLDLPDSNFKIARSQRNPRKYCLIQKSSNSARAYCFKKRDVEFVSMKDAELTMIMYRYDDQNDMWNVTCVYPSIALAQLFYKDMRFGLPNEMVRLRLADYLVKSDGTELGTELHLFVDSFEDYVTIVVVDDEDDPVLIFPTDAVSQIIKSGPREIVLYISINSDEPILYKFGFSNESLASLCSEILHRLCRHINATNFAEVSHRWYNDPNYKRLFNRIERLLERRIDG